MLHHHQHISMTRVDSLKKKNHDPQLCIFLPLNPFFLFFFSLSPLKLMFVKKN
jgi:hypothetical protein